MSSKPASVKTAKPDKPHTIHIESDADITAVMSELKKTSAKQVKLVSPKSAQVLTSPINLKLLRKAARAKNKELILITRDHGVKVLAAGIGIKTAADVNSPASIPDIDELQPGAKPSAATHSEEDQPESAPRRQDVARKKPSESDFNLKDTGESVAPQIDLSPPADSEKKLSPMTAKKKASKIKRIPTIDSMRNRLFIGFGLLIVLFGLWFYLTRIYPTAQVTITAQTQRVPVSLDLEVSDTFVDSSFDRRQLKAFTNEQTVTKEQPFEATGTRIDGDQATGSIKISNCSESSAFTVDLGTAFSSSSLNYTSTIAVVVPGAQFSGGSCSAAGEVTVSVRASQPGEQYNVSSGTSFAIADVNGSVEAVAVDDFSGGTTVELKVITQEDIDRAAEALTEQPDLEIKQQLIDNFTNDEFIVIEDSFTSTRSELRADPAVDTQADSGVAQVDITHSIVAIRRIDVESFISQVALTDAAETQDVSDLGLSELRLSIDTQDGPASLDITLVTDSYLGPKIDLAAIRESIAGKRFSEAETEIEAITGINDAVIDLSFFGFGTLPSNVEKISIELAVIDSPSQTAE